MTTYEYLSSDNWRGAAIPTKPHTWTRNLCGRMHVKLYLPRDEVSVHGMWRGACAQYETRSWNMTFLTFKNGHAYNWMGNAEEFDYATALKICWDSVHVDNMPTDPIALAIIAAIGTLPRPIAEEIIPHLVMSLCTLVESCAY